PSLEVVRFVPTVVAPKLVVPLVLVVVLRAPTVVPDTDRLPPATIARSEERRVATDKALTSFRLMFVPVAVTAPTKLFAALVSVIASAVVVMLPVLSTTSAPVRLTAPSLEVVRFVPTVVAPKLVVPLVLVVVLRAPTVVPDTDRLPPATIA